MRKPKTPAQSLTDNFVDAIGKIWPNTIMNWDTKMNGKFVPWGYVKQALAAIDRRDWEGARACLMRPLTTGLLGGPDITGIIGHVPGAMIHPGVMIGWEIKAKYSGGRTDEQTKNQIMCQKNIRRHGGIYLVVESVEQGIDATIKEIGARER